MHRLAHRLLIASFLVLATGHASARETEELTAQVDAIFAAFDGSETPGVSVAVWRDGALALSRAYGMADLERGVPNTTETIFECGSVAKQFTAAATILLAIDGALSLDDDVRTHVPELPEYADPITIRHLLNHTSGLRDWGAVAALEGWPRGRRDHDNEHALSIIAAQRALNHRPGHAYAYTNSGYNLLAIIVERVSGQPFGEFCTERIFEPLGMTRTEWRDDHQRIVRDRAIAYDATDDGWRTLMPNERAHGNGGLLTTAEDLIAFTVNLETGSLGGPVFVEEMHRVGVLADGSETTYASGLVVDEYRGVARVGHGGATAGYRANLARFPAHNLIVSTVANASTYRGLEARAVARLFLGEALEPVEASDHDADAHPLTRDEFNQLRGYYRDRRTGLPVRVGGDLERVSVRTLTGGTDRFRPTGPLQLRADDGRTLRFLPHDGDTGQFTAVVASGDDVEATYDRIPPFRMPDERLSAYAGRYQTDELRAVWEFVPDDGALTLRINHQTISLRPSFEDGFLASNGAIIAFRRSAEGTIDGLTAHRPRLWNMNLVRVADREPSDRSGVEVPAPRPTAPRPAASTGAR